MEKLQFDNDNFTLYSPDSLNYINRDLESILGESLSFYKTLFDIDNFRKIQINFFDDKDKFRKYIIEELGNDKLPEYASATFDGGMINAFINSDKNIEEWVKIKRQYLASHELFHMMYKELITDRYSLDRIVWFDEGMAQLFSGENDYLMNSFNSFVKYVKTKTSIIPDLNNISHGNTFNNNDYNGYNLSLIAVKYLYDLLGFDGFKELMKDNDRVLEYGNTVLNDAFEYYKEQQKSR